MRTRTVLSVAAALAAGAFMAQAQVYSVNIVGYVNQSLAANQLELVNNPLDDNTNTLASVYAGLANGSQAWVWNGAGYTPSAKAKGAWAPNLAIPTGTGLFVRSPSAITNTYVGEVLAGPGGSTTNGLTTATTATGSLLPIAGTLNDANLGLTQLANGSQLWQWNGAGYTPSAKAKGAWAPDLSVDVAEGIFIKSAAATDWVQTLPAN